MFRASSYLQALQQYASDIFEGVSNSTKNLTVDNDFIRVKLQDYDCIRSESIDYAVMEKADNVVVVEMNANWSDIGSWDAVWENSEKDDNQNVLIGDVINIESQNSYVFSDCYRYKRCFIGCPKRPCTEC
jgi:mannose-1-phosphate guanylyltransferase